MEYQMGQQLERLKKLARTDRMRRLRTVRDFLEIPPSEVARCLRTFRAWIERGQVALSDAQRDGKDPSNLGLEEFAWIVRADPTTHRPAAPYAATTDIRELGLRPSAMHKLRELNLYALEDFTESSEDELLAVADVGAATIAQIREYLHQIGLDFRPSRHPVRRALMAAKISRLLPAVARNVADDAAIAELGLRPPTVRRCLEKGICTVGELRQLTLRELWSFFGSKTILEVIETLWSVGLELVSQPTQLEKWKFGAVRKEQLQYPADDACVLELQPWLGAPCHTLKKWQASKLWARHVQSPRQAAYMSAGSDHPPGRASSIISA
jgi:hypothetical protein